jgi:hypothetical protein
MRRWNCGDVEDDGNQLLKILGSALKKYPPPPVGSYLLVVFYR